MRKSAHTSAMRISSSFDSSGYLYNHVFAFVKLLLPPPSIIYANRVHGAPQNPISGTSPSRAVRVMLIASNTYPSSSFTSTLGFNFSGMSAGVRSGSGKDGNGFMSTSMPIACGTTRMSQKMIAESSRPLYRRMGCSVTSVASEGVRQTSKNSCFSRTCRNSTWVVMI